MRGSDKHKKTRSGAVRSKLERALALDHEGHLPGAEALYREALKERHREQQARLGLSVLLTRRGCASSRVTSPAARMNGSAEARPCSAS